MAGCSWWTSCWRPQPDNTAAPHKPQAEPAPTPSSAVTFVPPLPTSHASAVVEPQQQQQHNADTPPPATQPSSGLARILCSTSPGSEVPTQVTPTHPSSNSSPPSSSTLKGIPEHETAAPSSPGPPSPSPPTSARPMPSDADHDAGTPGTYLPSLLQPGRVLSTILESNSNSMNSIAGISLFATTTTSQSQSQSQSKSTGAHTGTSSSNQASMAMQGTGDGCSEETAVAQVVVMAPQSFLDLHPVTYNVQPQLPTELPTNGLTNTEPTAATSLQFTRQIQQMQQLAATQPPATATGTANGHAHNPIAAAVRAASTATAVADVAPGQQTFWQDTAGPGSLDASTDGHLMLHTLSALVPSSSAMAVDGTLLNAPDVHNVVFRNGAADTKDVERPSSWKPGSFVMTSVASRVSSHVGSGETPSVAQGSIASLPAESGSGAAGSALQSASSHLQHSSGEWAAVGSSVMVRGGGSSSHTTVGGATPQPLGLGSFDGLQIKVTSPEKLLLPTLHDTRVAATAHQQDHAHHAVSALDFVLLTQAPGQGAANSRSVMGVQPLALTQRLKAVIATPVVSAVHSSQQSAVTNTPARSDLAFPAASAPLPITLGTAVSAAAAAAGAGAAGDVVTREPRRSPPATVPQYSASSSSHLSGGLTYVQPRQSRLSVSSDAGTSGQLGTPGAAPQVSTGRTLPSTSARRRYSSYDSFHASGKPGPPTTRAYPRSSTHSGQISGRTSAPANLSTSPKQRNLGGAAAATDLFNQFGPLSASHLPSSPSVGAAADRSRPATVDGRPASLSQLWQRVAEGSPTAMGNSIRRANTTLPAGLPSMMPGPAVAPEGVSTSGKLKRQLIAVRPVPRPRAAREPDGGIMHLDID